MLRNILKYSKSLLINFLNPILTILKYPHVKLLNGVSLHNCKVDPDVTIYGRTTISNSVIGKFSYIGGKSEIMNARIGKFCSIAPQVKIGLGIHPTNYISTYPGFYTTRNSVPISLFEEKNVIEHENVEIKNDVWIGYGVTIMDGVKIGNGAIIAAGSIVVNDIPDYAIVGGIPAKIIKMRFSPEKIGILLGLEWWERDPEFLKEKGDLFLNPDLFFKNFEEV